jgi:hypothetical protein
MIRLLLLLLLQPTGVQTAERSATSMSAKDLRPEGFPSGFP